MLDLFYQSTFILFKKIVTKLPLSWTHRLIHGLATMGYIMGGKFNRIALTNLDIAFGAIKSDEDKRAIVKHCYLNLLHLLKDFVYNQTITQEALLKKITFCNEHFYHHAAETRKGVIFMTAHYGNWELLSLSLGAKYGALSVIGRKLDSPSMNAILEANRQRFNVTLLDKKGATKGILKALNMGANVGLLVDQNTAEKEGLLIDFFDKKARHTPAATLFASKTKAMIVPVFITTTDFQHYTITFYEPIAPPQDTSVESTLHVTQQQASVTQHVIEKKPDEWFWFHKRWKNQYPHLYK